MAKKDKKFWKVTQEGAEKINEAGYDLLVDTLASSVDSVAVVRSEDKTSAAITAPIGVMKKEAAEEFVESIMPEIETIAAKLETSDKAEIEKNFSTDSEGNNLVTIFIPAEADMDEIKKILSESIGFKPKKKSKDGDSKKTDKKSKDSDDSKDDSKKKTSKKSKDSNDSKDDSKKKTGKKSKDGDDDSGDKKSKKELSTVEKFDALCGSDADAAKKIAENSLYKAARARGSFGSTMTAVINRTYDEVLG